MSIFGRSRRASRLLSGMLFGALIAATPLAGAQTPPTPFPGLYRIGIDATGAAPSAGQCLIRGDNGNGNFIRHLWTEMPNGKSRWCGFPSQDAFLRNRQGVWHVAPVYLYDGTKDTYVLWHRDGKCLGSSPDGTTRVIRCADVMGSGRQGIWYIDTRTRVGSTVYASIRAMSDNRCLIFSNNGYDVRPTLHRWGDVPNDPLFCGLGLEGLLHNGQGLFSFTKVSDSTDGIFEP